MNPSAAFNAGVPAFGTWVLYAFLVTAGIAFALAVAAGTSDRLTAPRMLRAAQFAGLGTCALIFLDVLILAYAFTSHDFRVRYVMKYSDRSMPGQYLLAALWGGQDGSLLWWTFLLGCFSAACILWMRGKHRELAPWVIATLMGVTIFFGVLMAFAANPFAANVAGAPPDGEGLNPALQNFYMAIHPPSLYTGFVGCVVPFSFAVAALITGRLDDEWVKAMRRWALFAWLFLSIGNTLGMLWAYEELGWGGFWAWDPVENAAAMPWFTVTAFLHSMMIQERRDSLRVWNVSLVLGSFVLTIFGTFLTRSGLISSVHAFAQSDVGIYFIYFLVFLVIFCVTLVVWRLPKLRKPTEIDSVLSREAMFVANNWLLLGICLFIVIATTWPKVSEWLWHERLTVGASFYNFWLPIPGVVLMALTCIGTLTPWRKASEQLLWRAFRGPLATAAVVALLHVFFGHLIGRPAVVHIDPIYPSLVGRVMASVDGHLPAVMTSMIAFNIAAVVQEFYRGTQARHRSKSEGWFTSFGRLVSRNRRRYGGYIVHVGIAMMFLGWSGQYWHSEAEALLRPGETMTVGEYTVRYDGFESRRDPNKRMVFANVTIFRRGQVYAVAHPAKFIYTTHPEMPTSEVSITPSLREDVYVVMASVNATTHTAH
ncbi:MAG: cytochrome c-type biogenesis CcmF C-terminal domain-containing protein, partial [Deltaproteobacteria bacterium]